MPSQRQDVFLAFTQWRDEQRHYIEPVEQILAKLSRLHLRFQRLVGGAKHPNIERNRPLAAHGFKHLLLQHAQQARLQFERQLGNFVEKQAALVGLNKAPLAIAGGSGKCALAVAEKLRFEQIARNGAAVDGHKGQIPALTRQVNPPRQQLLARATLALDQDGGIRRSYTFSHGHHIGHTLRGKD